MEYIIWYIKQLNDLFCIYIIYLSQQKFYISIANDYFIFHFVNDRINGIV